MSATDPNKKETVDKKINDTSVSVSAYDQAIVTDLRQRFSGTKVNDTVQIVNAENAFNIIGTLNKDKIDLPFISLQRNSWELNDEQAYQKFEGGKLVTTTDNEGHKREVRVQVLPITINYTLSIWTKDRITNDAILRELIFYYKIKPTLLVYIPHGLNLRHVFNLYFENNITDNSDLAEYTQKMNYVRQDIGIYTNDAYLWKSNFRDTVAINNNLNFYYDIDSQYNIKEGGNNNV